MRGDDGDCIPQKLSMVYSSGVGRRKGSEERSDKANTRVITMLPPDASSTGRPAIKKKKKKKKI
jgi:hypothetical protein